MPSHSLKSEELQEKTEERDKLVKVINKSERQLHEFDAQESKMKKVVQSARQKVEDVKVSLQAAQVRGTVHKSLMQQAQSGRIKGICVRRIFLYLS